MFFCFAFISWTFMYVNIPKKYFWDSMHEPMVIIYHMHDLPLIRFFHAWMMADKGHVYMHNLQAQVSIMHEPSCKPPGADLDWIKASTSGSTVTTRKSCPFSKPELPTLPWRSTLQTSHPKIDIICYLCFLKSLLYHLFYNTLLL